MQDKIILTKVSDSKIKKSDNNVAVYEADNGLTIIFRYHDDGYVEDEAGVRYTQLKSF